LWQARHVASMIRTIHPDIEIVETIIVTSGDKFQGKTAAEISPGGKEVWVKEIEEALLSGAVDLAVHSLKDVPAFLPEGLVLGAFPRRADPRDALVGATSLAALREGARVGTTSVRRICQLRALRPDLQFHPLRGNVETRLRRVEEGVVDAAILASAGLDRLGFSDRIGARLSFHEVLPAVGQGSLAIEIRSDDRECQALCAHLNDPDTATAVAAERALLEALGGSCQTPIGGHAWLDGGLLQVHGVVGEIEGDRLQRESASGAPEQAVALGQVVALRLRGT
jgi:hydroxymethylbilane synthase